MLYFVLLARELRLFIRWKTFYILQPAPLCPFSVLCLGLRADEVLTEACTNEVQAASLRAKNLPFLSPPSLFFLLPSLPIKCLKTGSFLKIESSTAKNSTGPPSCQGKGRRIGVKQRRSAHIFPSENFYSCSRTTTDSSVLRSQLKSNLLRADFFLPF